MENDNLWPWLMIGGGAYLLYTLGKKNGAKAAPAQLPAAVASATAGPPPAQTAAPVSVPTPAPQGQAFEPIPDEFSEVGGPSVDELAAAPPVYQ